MADPVRKPGALRRIAVAAALVLMLVLGASAARADTKIGVVLLHGKLGMPLGVGNGGRGAASGARLVAALKGAGYLVATPELCWSRRRGFDKPRAECLAEVDQAIAGLKSDGATAIVVGGLSLGGNEAIVYGTAHPELLGVIAMAPADDARVKSGRPAIAAALAQARALAASGRGDQRAEFADVNTGAQGSYPMALDTTAHIYLSFFDPATVGGIPDNLAKLKVPLLYVAGDADPTQRKADANFAAAPKNATNRFVRVAANHLATPDAATDAVLQWLGQLGKQ
jgi:pimeloyl-ACP methyl ester carboxylesterase